MSRHIRPAWIVTLNSQVTEHEWLAERFEGQRARLRTVAYRMLGSVSEADDAVQEAWLRLSRADASSVDNIAGWLTTVVARICLDILRSRKTRGEEPLGVHLTEPALNPEQEALLADSVGIALLVVLETLDPAERVAFVLHDMFAVPFDDIAPIVGRTPGAARQLASRGRRRVRGARTTQDTDLARRQEVVAAFLAASRDGNFTALLEVLDPDVVLRADMEAVTIGAEGEIRGASAVAATFAGRARVARPALINGAPGLVWSQAGRPRIVFEFILQDGKIVAIDLIADPERLREMELVFSSPE